LTLAGTRPPATTVKVAKLAQPGANEAILFTAITQKTAVAHAVVPEKRTAGRQ